MEGGEGEEVNIQELAANLSTYKDQLQQVLSFVSVCIIFMLEWIFCFCVNYSLKARSY